MEQDEKEAKWPILEESEVNDKRKRNNDSWRRNIKYEQSVSPFQWNRGGLADIRMRDDGCHGGELSAAGNNPACSYSATRHTVSGPSETVSKTEIRSKILHLGAKTTKRMEQALYTRNTENSN